MWYKEALEPNVVLFHNELWSDATGCLSSDATETTIGWGGGRDRQRAASHVALHMSSIEGSCTSCADTNELYSSYGFNVV